MRSLCSKRGRPQRLRELRPFHEPCAQALEVTLTERDGAAPRGAVGRVREADEPLAARGAREAARSRRTAARPPAGERSALRSSSARPQGVAVFVLGSWQRRYAENRHRSEDGFRANVVPALSRDAERRDRQEVVDLPVAAGAERRDLDRADDDETSATTGSGASRPPLERSFERRRPVAAAREDREIGEPEQLVEQAIPETRTRKPLSVPPRSLPNMRT